MFLSKNEIKRKVAEIVLDDSDNDIIFIVATKGIGKLKLLSEIYDKQSCDEDVIVADGKYSSGKFSSIKNAFAEGIIKYIRKNNFNSVRLKFKNLLKRFNVRLSLIKVMKRNKNKNDELDITNALLNLTIEQLKELYFYLADKTPLIIFLTCIKLSDDDIRYLKSLHLDKWGAKITFVIALRTDFDCSTLINDILKYKSNGVWVFPLLPDILSYSNNQGLLFASISINEIGDSKDYYKFRRAILGNQMYVEMYDFVAKLFEDGISPHQLFFLANQEMNIYDFQYLKKITKSLYGQYGTCDSTIILPYSGKLLWLDSLSYYLMINDCIEEAVISTQKLFFDILLNLDKFTYSKIERNELTLFLKNVSESKDNSLAEGFSNYFSNFAQLVTIFATNSFNFISMPKVIDLLDHMMLQFSETNINAIMAIFEETQICSILDLGLSSIRSFFYSIKEETIIDEHINASIRNFLKICLSNAYKWLDLTLVKEIVETQEVIKASGNIIRFDFAELTKDKDKMLIYDAFIELLYKKELTIGDVIMPKNTIFLSYAHADKKIASEIDINLRDYGYDVKRDERDLKSWDNLTDFMKGIRKQDYVVILVSDTYLRRENCMNEIIELLKDEQYSKKTYPIILESSGVNMFSMEYQIEIVLYWQDCANNLEEKLKRIKRENSAELDLRYRNISKIAQNASEFMNTFFNNELLAVISKQYPLNEIIRDLDCNIQSQ